MDESRQIDQRLPEGFRDTYIKSLLNQDIKPGAIRWYVLRAERFLKTHHETPLDRIGPEDITRYLERAGRSSRLTDWQFRQVVNAIRNIFPHIPDIVEIEMDRDYWLESSRSLTHDHKTIAREVVDSDSVPGDSDSCRCEKGYQYERFSKEFTGMPPGNGSGNIVFPGGKLSTDPRSKKPEVAIYES
jgi:hypothetical protein